MSTEQLVGWDSRERWTALLIKQIEIVLTSNQADIKAWYEALHDFYDMAACALSDSDGYEKELKEIEGLIYGRRLNGKVLTQDQKRVRHEQAYYRMRAFFRRAHKELFDSGLLIPFQQRKDVHRAIANYYEK